MDKRKDIIAYLSGPRDYREGVALYDRYGLNLMLKRKFRYDESAATKEIMIDELRKLAGLSVADMAALPRRAHGTPTAEPKPMPTGSVATETVRKMSSFRERFPFLADPDCPDILKVLTADMFTAYDTYKRLHADLQKMPDDTIAEAAGKCRDLVEAYLANQEIWDELNYYKEHGEVLGKAAKFRDIQEQEDLSAMTDVELMKKINSARSNVSKRKAALQSMSEADEGYANAVEMLGQWQDKKILYESELEVRKKKP